ncbi:MAG: 50S ribosomal protein L22 [Candidatus Andersenbacteria bacterium]
MPTATKSKSVHAVIRYIHQAPQKVRRVADVVRSLDVEAAEHVLASLPKRATLPVWKAIKSAASNAVHNHDLDKARLYIQSIQVNPSMTLPRFAPRAQGRAFKIRKRFSHIDVVVAERPEKAAAPATAKRAPAKKTK